MSRSSLEELAIRWRQSHDQAAAEEIYLRLRDRLLRYSSKRLSTLLRTKVSPSSVVQIVLNEVLRNLAGGKYAACDSHGLERLAERIAEHRIRNLWDFFTAQVRDIRRETNAADGDGAVPEALVPQAREGTPAEMAEVADRVARAWDLACRRLPPKLLEVWRLDLEGRSKAQIAERFQVSTRTIELWFNKISAALSEPAEN